MKFNQTFYHYQKEILKVFEGELERWDNKIHIVAPPWSWKTIVGLEIMNNLFSKKEWISLILVPNTVLQKQWKDKIDKFFLEQDEDIENLVSFDMDKISKINILTYQAISWQNREEFTKKTRKLNKKILKYFWEIKNHWVCSIVLDEAHHLTAWWSKVLFKLYVFLSTPIKKKDLNLTDEIFFHITYFKLKKEIRPYIVWLTATPPFVDVDYFSLDDNYIDLLWKVDYYIPTPAIIKSWKLAPYNDLVQFVELPKNSSDMLEEKKQKLDKLIFENKWNIEKFYISFLQNYNKKVIEDKNISKIFSFCNLYLDLKSDKFNLQNFNKLDFDSIVYSVSIWLKTKSLSNNKKEIFEDFKKILYEIWYVWKNNKFTKYYSYIDKLEIYNPEKINAVKSILNKELENLWNDLRCVIITDFFEDIDLLLDCKSILKWLNNYKELNPILVSGQWIFDLKLEKIEKNILDITNNFKEWKTKLLIWTRGILWEWWDSPKVNTLIDLTWVNSFMSVNQVRWRAIRQDKENLKKVANIYDIVTIDKNNVLYKDFKRLIKKHNQVYWINDLGLVIKWINHIYQDLSKINFNNINKINEMMLKRSEKRNYFYKLWWIWEDFKNKEQFILQLNVNPLFKFFPKQDNLFSYFYRLFFRYKKIELSSLNEVTYYDKIIKKFINRFLNASKEVLIEKWVLSENFSYKILIEGAWKYKIIWWRKSWDFEIKKFIEIVSEIFSPVLMQRYFLKEKIFELQGNQYKSITYNFSLPSQLSWNKKERKIFYNRFYKIFFEDNYYEISKNFEYIIYNRKKYLWYETFIKSEIEKIWI